MLGVTVVLLALVFVLAVIVAGSAAVQAALLVDELPAPAFGTAASADLNAHYRLLSGGAVVAVTALIAAATVSVIASHPRAAAARTRSVTSPSRTD